MSLKTTVLTAGAVMLGVALLSDTNFEALRKELRQIQETMYDTLRFLYPADNGEPDLNEQFKAASKLIPTFEQEWNHACKQRDRVLAGKFDLDEFAHEHGTFSNMKTICTEDTLGYEQQLLTACYLEKLFLHHRRFSDGQSYEEYERDLWNETCFQFTRESGKRTGNEDETNKIDYKSLCNEKKKYAKELYNTYYKQKTKKILERVEQLNADGVDARILLQHWENRKDERVSKLYKPLSELVHRQLEKRLPIHDLRELITKYAFPQPKEQEGQTESETQL